MKLLIMTGSLYPQAGNNANLIGKLISQFLATGHEVHLLSTATGAEESKLPAECFGVPVHWVTDRRRDWRRRLLYPAIAKIVDPNGFSDAIQAQVLLRELKTVRNSFPFDAVISTSEPYPMAIAASQLDGGRKALYMMDPPACVSNGTETVYRNRTLPRMLKNQTAVITTPFISDALIANSYRLPHKSVSVGFPMITDHMPKRTAPDDNRIHLLFCGWLYSEIRSPRNFLDIVSRLDERFEVTFMGRECELLQERFPTETRASIITLPNQPYDVALQAMADADIMINIGNSVPVHMPSKTLEYINTGKPFVNFYKMDDCPTLYYTKRYPLCLNLFEGDGDVDAAARRFIDFCAENKGKTVDRSYIEREYEDCTPQYIAQKILDCLEK